MSNYKARKSGARHSASDSKMIQEVHDHACALGAACPTPDAEQGESTPPTDAEVKAALKSFPNSPLNIITAKIHEAYTVACDQLLMRGYIAQDRRLAIGGLIGGLLMEMQATIESEMPELTAPIVDPECADAIAAKTADKPTLSFNYIKRLHLPHAEQFQKDVAAVKSTGRDTVRGYSMLWGDESLVDVESDFFTKQSNFWDAELKGVVRPLTYDHGQDAKTAAISVIGEIKTFGDDEWGRWYEAQLNRNTAYRSFLDRLISERALGTSSDSAPQYVIRKKSANGSFWLAQWPWFASALTTTPAEPRMLREDALYWKSAGVTLPTPGQVAPDGAQTQSNLALLEVLKLKV